ncbi:MAG: hypothetical protein IPG50_26535 [Myxococcales bacterium]|nr:hypothetical protein [Myxococcales bacterium]
MRRRLLVLGVGYAGEHILAARGRESSLGLVRREVRRAELEARGLDAERTDELASRVLALADETTHVVVTFPRWHHRPARRRRPLEGTARCCDLPLVDGRLRGAPRRRRR